MRIYIAGPYTRGDVVVNVRKTWNGCQFAICSGGFRAKVPALTGKSSLPKRTASPCTMTI